MLIWASTLQRPLFACLWKSMQKYILNGYCIRDERHFWCFPQLSSRDLSRPGNGIPLLSIFILHRVRHRYAARKTRFLTKFCKLVVYLLFFFFFFLNVYRFPSKTPPRLKFLPFHPIYFQYIYISCSTMKEFQTVSRICPLLLLLHLVLFPHLHFISRNNQPRKFRRGKYFVVKTVTKLVRISSALI